MLDEQRDAVDPTSWAPDWPGFDQFDNAGRKRRTDLFLAHDIVSTAPFATYVIWESPGKAGPDGRFYPRASIVIVDEFASNKPGDVTKGMGWTVPTLAEEIASMSPTE